MGVTDIDPFVLNLAQGAVSGLSTGTAAAAVLIAASSTTTCSKACTPRSFTAGLRASANCNRRRFIVLAVATAEWLRALIGAGT